MSRRDQLITDALAIEAEEAKEAGALGYMARAMVQATMPHRRQEGTEFVRQNGAYTMSLLSPSSVGLPYGNIPRLMVAYLTTEAVRTRQREIVLGSSLSEFMSQLGLVPTGGRWGSITRLRDQARRLLSSSVTCTYEGDDGYGVEAVRVADRAQLWWDPIQPDQQALWESRIVLGERFFEEVTERPVPIDMRALSALRQSSMALDIYSWLTYRMSYLSRPTVLPWAALQAQFGADYSETRYFKRQFLKHLKQVAVVYPNARVNAVEYGLELRPSSPHLPRV